MRFARFAPLALAMLPATAASEVSESQPRAGQYRTALELIEFEVPGDSEHRARDAFAAELVLGNDFCLKSDAGDEAIDRKMLAHIAEGECTFGRFDRTGAAVSAAMVCTRDTTVGSQVTMNGRIWAENADLDMILEQELETGVTRIRVRARSVRSGDC